MSCEYDPYCIIVCVYCLLGLTGVSKSRTAAMLPFLLSRSWVSQPPSLVKPMASMFSIADWMCAPVIEIHDLEK